MPVDNGLYTVLHRVFSTDARRCLQPRTGTSRRGVHLAHDLRIGGRSVHIVSIATQKRDWLKVARIERAGARRRRYNALIDSVGVANTPIDLTGNATINDINLVVYSETPIKQGERVRITGITPDKIIVERVAQADCEA